MFLMAWATAATNKLVLTFADPSGRRSKMGVWVDDSINTMVSAGVVAIKDAAQACSDAKIEKAELLMYAKDDAPGAAESDPFDRPTDKLELVFASTEGIETTIKLPSVKSAYYQTDRVTPLTTAGPAATLIALIKANCCTADGQALDVQKKARRMVPKGLKTWNKPGLI
jgi:hypothetical protein